MKYKLTLIMIILLILTVGLFVLLVTLNDPTTNESQPSVPQKKILELTEKHIQDPLPPILKDYGYSGFEIYQFKVNAIKIKDKNFTNPSYNLRNEFIIEGNKIKHILNYTNKIDSNVRVNISTVIKIDYNEIRWNGSTYNLNSYNKNNPLRLQPYIHPRTRELVSPNIFMGKENKRINYKDIGDQGGYAIAYKDTDYYIELIIDNINVASLGNYFLDPIYLNRTDGFSVSAAGAADPVGITLNDTEFWITDNTDNFVYHFNSTMDNRTDGFHISPQITATGRLTLDTTDNSFWITENTGTFVSHFNSAGVNQSDGYNTNDSGASFLFGIAFDPTDNSHWIIDADTIGAEDFLYHFNSSRDNQTDGFSLQPIGSNSSRGITFDTRDNSFWITDVEDDFVYHVNSSGDNQTDGFDISGFGSSTPDGIAFDILDNSLWVVDNTDAFVYHFGFDVNLSVNLTLPVNNTRTLNSSLIFEANVTPSNNFNLTNATIHLYNSSSDLINTTTNILTGNDTNLTSFNLSFEVGVHQWNVLGCEDNLTSTTCSFAEANFTFERTVFTENSQTFNATTIEGSLEGFTINVTYNNDAFTNIDAILSYNGSNFTSTQSGSGATVTFTTQIGVPLVTSQTNFSFNWTITVSNSTFIASTRSTTNNQTVNNLNIDDCSSFGILLANYSLLDEETQDTLNVSLFNSSVEVDLRIFSKDSSHLTAVINFTGNFSENSNPQICLENDIANSEYEIDIQTRYLADDYAKEFHNIRNATLTNSSLPIQISLFDLLLTDTTEFLITFKDDTFLPIENALLDIQRKYVNEGVFKTVEAPLTDENGQALTHLDRDGVIYQIIVTKDRQTLAIFDNIAVVCQDVIIGDCDINLNALSTVKTLSTLEDVGNISLSFTFNDTARVVTMTFVTTDGLSKTISLNSTKFDRFGNETVCTDILTSTSGTLSCTIPDSFGNVTVISEVFVNGNRVSQKYFTIAADIFGEFGQSNIGGLLLVLIITIPLMFIPSIIGLLFGLIIGFIMASFLLFTRGGILGTSSAILWLIIATGIIMYKISRRESG